MTNLDPTTQLSIAELVIYLILVPVILYILIRHGKTSYPGWSFLIVFCGLRLTSDGIQIANHNNAAKGGSTGSSGAIINSIGLSGLLYSQSGIIHECYHRIPNHNRKISVIIQLLLHLVISGGIALTAVGGANLAKPESPTNSHSTDNALRKTGSLMLLLSAVLLVIYAHHTYRRLRSLPSARRDCNTILLLYSTMLALPFTRIRAIYSVVYAFDTSPTVNPITGIFAVKFVLIFLVQLLAVLFLAAGGIVTRNIRVEDKDMLRATSSEPGRGNLREEVVIDRYGDAEKQRTKGLGSGYR